MAYTVRFGGVAYVVGTYLIASIVCLLVPPAAVRAWSPCLWLLGPSANLVHGTSYLVPFYVGTLVIGGLAWGVQRSRASSFRRKIMTVGLVGAWAAFGALAYAPGA